MNKTLRGVLVPRFCLRPCDRRDVIAVIAALAVVTVVTVSPVMNVATVMAQAPVTGAADPESLFTSPDPKLNANKQVVLHIMRDLLEANHWELADKATSRKSTFSTIRMSASGLRAGPQALRRP